MFVLSKEEMYFYDKHTIEKIGIPGKTLMENAGRGCAEFITNEILETSGIVKNPDHKIIVFCGNGNNGGDGFVIARYLFENEYEVEVVLTGKIEKMSLETRENFDKCQKLEIPIEIINDRAGWESADIELDKYSIIVDAIFGIGFQGNVRGWLKEIFAIINLSTALKIAIDISSGIEADTGKAEDAIISDYTLTMANYKYGHFLGEGRNRSGSVLVIDIGIPSEVYTAFPPTGKLITADNVVFPVRSILSHKGDYGKVGIIAGSPGYSGAAIMASKAALRTGAGIIKLFHPPGMETIFETSLIEVMTHPIPTDENGKICPENLIEPLNDLDVLLMGPGIGTSPQTKHFLTYLMKYWQKPMLLDADALNIISANPELKSWLKNKLLTPHIGEFARLCGKQTVDIMADTIPHLKMFSAKYECSVLLKSSTTIFCNGQELVFDISGNDGLSTGGSGDVLAGIIISFLGQKLDMENAAVSASYLLGITAENLAETRKPASIIPTEIIDQLFKY
jgi:ADP-dependent NAD(P)H-hydrate dehydratase / NAD(P)H-hydrate epimerase